MAMAAKAGRPLALGFLEKLDKPLYHDACISLSSTAASAAPSNGRVRDSPGTNHSSACATDSSQTPSTSQSSSVQEPEIVLEVVCNKPEVVAVDQNRVSVCWQQPSLAQSADSVASSSPPSATYSFKVELQLVGTSGVPLDTQGAWSCAYAGSELACKVDKLLAGRTYALRLSAVASSPCDLVVPPAGAGEQEEEAPSSSREYTFQVHQPDVFLFQTLPSVPSAIQPPALAQRARNALKLKWNAPEDPGGEFELAYVLQISPAPAGMEDKRAFMGFVEVYRGPERSYKVTKLQPGVRYTSRVQAINQLGEGPFSLCSAFTTQATVPTAPQPPVCTMAASNAVTLEWVAPPDNGSPISAYILERSDASGDFQLAYAGPNPTCTVSGLKPGASYRFRLRADNDEGKSAWSAVADISTGAAPPDCPLALQVVSANRTSATLAWRAPDDNGGSKVVAFEVELQAKSKAATACMGSDWLKIFEGEAHACTINSLRPGCAYRARVRARNSAGWGQWALPVDLATAADVPEVPLALQAPTCTSTTLILTWAPPRHDCGAKVQAYRMEMVPAGCSCNACPASARPTPCPAHALHPVYAGETCGAEVHHLQPGTSYLFRVQAVNAQGPSTWTEWTQATTLAAPPTQPAAPAVISAASNSLQVEWQSPMAHGAPVTHFSVDAAQLPGDDPRLAAASAAAECDSSGSSDLPFRQVYKGPQTSCELRGLEPYTAYAVRVCAHNEVGSSVWSPYSVAVTGHACPSAPEHVSAQALSAQEVQLTWQPPARDFGASVSSYTVEQCVLAARPGGAAAPAAPWQQVYSGSSCTCTAGGLAPGKPYQYRVRAANACGWGPFSAPAQATTLPAPPSAPGRPVVSQRAATSLKVRWDEPTLWNGAPVTTYCLEVCLAGTDEWRVEYSGVEPVAKLTGLQPASKYLLRVAANNMAGQGPYGDSDAAVTQLLPPSPPSGMAASEPEVLHGTDAASVAVTWLEPATTATTAPAIGYELVAAPKDGPASATVKQTVARRCDTKLEGLALGMTYGLRLRAVGAEGTGHSGWSEEVTFATPGRVRAHSMVRDDTASVSSETSALVVPAGTASAGAASGPARGKASKRAAKRAAPAPSAVVAAPASSSEDMDDGPGPVGSRAAKGAKAGERRVAAASAVAAAKKRPVVAKDTLSVRLDQWLRHYTGVSLKTVGVVLKAVVIIVLVLWALWWVVRESLASKASHPHH